MRHISCSEDVKLVALRRIEKDGSYFSALEHKKYELINVSNNESNNYHLLNRVR